MFQRPQTIVFFVAAILAILATFSPIASIAPNVDNPSNVRLIVRASDMDFDMDKPEDKMSDKEFEEGLTTFNERLDEDLDDRGISLVFMIGFVGMMLLTALIILNALMYKNRKFQIGFGVFLTIITVLVTVGIFVLSRGAVDILADLNIIPSRAANVDWAISYSYGFFMFPVIAILLIVGVLLVRKDDNLIRSIDRIR